MTTQLKKGLRRRLVRECGRSDAEVRRFLLAEGAGSLVSEWDDLRVGDGICALRSSAVNPAGAIGVVYEVYEIDGRKGVSIIFGHGGYDGWSLHDYVLFDLYRVGSTDLAYTFTNVGQLQDDFYRGVFDRAIAKSALAWAASPR